MANPVSTFTPAYKRIQQPTETYLYEQLAGWAKSELGIEAALVTGSGRNQSTLPLRRDARDCFFLVAYYDSCKDLT